MTVAQLEMTTIRFLVESFQLQPTRQNKILINMAYHLSHLVTLKRFSAAIALFPGYINVGSLIACHYRCRFESAPASAIKVRQNKEMITQSDIPYPYKQ